jgi:hypothetical protein
MNAERKRILVSSFGAGIVLITFIANERFRDNYKESLDDLNAASAQLNIRSDITASQETTQELVLAGRWYGNSEDPGIFGVDNAVWLYRNDVDELAAARDVLEILRAEQDMKSLVDAQMKKVGDLGDQLRELLKQ